MTIEFAGKILPVSVQIPWYLSNFSKGLCLSRKIFDIRAHDKEVGIPPCHIQYGGESRSEQCEIQ
jgi:hypothetical protein